MHRSLLQDTMMCRVQTRERERERFTPQHYSINLCLFTLRAVLRGRKSCLCMSPGEHSIILILLDHLLSFSVWMINVRSARAYDVAHVRHLSLSLGRSNPKLHARALSFSVSPGHRGRSRPRAKMPTCMFYAGERV